MGPGGGYTDIKASFFTAWHAQSLSAVKCGMPTCASRLTVKAMAAFWYSASKAAPPRSLQCPMRFSTVAASSCWRSVCGSPGGRSAACIARRHISGPPGHGATSSHLRRHRHCLLRNTGARHTRRIDRRIWYILRELRLAARLALHFIAFTARHTQCT